MDYSYQLNNILTTPSPDDDYAASKPARHNINGAKVLNRETFSSYGELVRVHREFSSTKRVFHAIIEERAYLSVNAKTARACQPGHLLKDT